MSNLRDMPSLPARAVDRLFARFAAMFGAAAMQRMWADMPMDDVKDAWADSLGRFSLDEILGGLRALEDAGSSFTPSLPEFVALCKRKPAPIPEAHRALALPAPRTDADLAAARDKVERLLSTVGRTPRRDNLQWAYRVVERYRGGDRVVAHCSYKIAMEALTEAGRDIPA